MSRSGSKVQRALFTVFLTSCTASTVLGLLWIWGIDVVMRPFLGRVLATAVVLTVASALTLSARRLVTGPPAEDDGST